MRPSKLIKDDTVSLQGKKLISIYFPALVAALLDFARAPKVHDLHSQLDTAMVFLVSVILHGVLCCPSTSAQWVHVLPLLCVRHLSVYPS